MFSFRNCRNFWDHPLGTFVLSVLVLRRSNAYGMMGRRTYKSRRLIALSNRVRAIIVNNADLNHRQIPGLGSYDSKYWEIISILENIDSINYVGVRSLNSGKFERANWGLKIKLSRGVMILFLWQGGKPPCTLDSWVRIYGHMVWSIDQAKPSSAVAF